MTILVKKIMCSPILHLSYQLKSRKTDGSSSQCKMTPKFLRNYDLKSLSIYTVYAFIILVNTSVF